MPIERTPLTSFQVKSAEKRIGIYHPIIRILETHEDELKKLYNSSLEAQETTDQQEFARVHLGFLADKIVGIDRFTLEPLEIIGIWSKVVEIFPASSYLRRSVASIITTTYMIQREDPSLSGFPKYYMENWQISPEILSDRDLVGRMQKRLGEINTSIEDIHSYIHDVKDPLQLGMKLQRRVQEEDTEAQVELDELKRIHIERTTPVLAESY